MGTVIIHGDDQAKTRLELQRVINEAKEKGISDVVALNGASLTLELVMQNLESVSFFGDSNRLTVIEGLHTLKSKNQMGEIVDYISKMDTGSVVLWETKELTATQLKKFPTAKVITAKVPAVIFKLTDALIPKQQLAIILPIFKSACAADSAELVLIMMARQLKTMIQSFDPGYKLPPFLKAKVEKAAKGFGLEKLTAMYHDLAVMDVQNKTGQLTTNLESELAFWLCKLYS